MKQLIEEIREIKDLITKTELGRKQILTIDEAAAFTGLKKSYLYRKTSNGEIPYFKPGGKKIYFDKKDIIDYLRRYKKNQRVDDEELADNLLNDHMQ